MKTNNVNNYELVFEHDQAIFLSSDYNRITQRTKTTYTNDKNALNIPVLNKLYQISLSNGTIWDAAAPLEPVPVQTRLLIMHYLIYSKDTAYITGEEIPFHSIRGVSHFEAAFNREAIPPLKRTFDKNLDSFLEAGTALEGTLCTYGDASIKLWLFPMIPITYILWEGDEEFPMNVNILFDKGITSCTHPEDVPVVGSYGAQQLAELSHQLQKQ